MKTGRPKGRVRAFGQPGQKGRQIQVPGAIHGPAPGQGRQGTVVHQPGVRQAFQFHGRLGLEALFGAQAQEAAHPVEKAAQAGGARTIQASLQHLADALGQGRVQGRIAAGQEGGNLCPPAQAPEGGGGQAPGFPGGLVPPGQGQGGEPGQTLPIRPVHPQQFPAPQFPGGAQAEAVQSQAQNRFAAPGLGPVFRQHGGDVGVVVGDGIGGNAPGGGEIRRQPGRGKIRMEVVGHRRRGGVQHVEQVLGRLFQVSHCSCVAQVADVLGKNGFPALNEAQGVFQVAAEGQHTGAIVRELDGPGGLAPAPAQELDGAPGVAHHRIIGPHHNVPVVEQEGIRQTGQTAQGLGVVRDQGLAPRIGAGHDQAQILGRGQPGQASGTTGGGVEEQVMEGSVGQHAAQPGQARSHIGRQGRGPLRRLGATAQQHDGAFRQFQEPGFVPGQLAEATHAGHIGQHQGKGLFFPLFAAPQFGHGGGIGGVAGQVKAAVAFDGQDFPRLEQGHRRQHRIIPGSGQPGPGQGPPLGVQQTQSGAAHGAAIGFRMEAPIGRVPVFPAAFRAQGKGGQGGAGPVVGQFPGNGIAGAAVGTVGEGVAVAPVVRVE